MTKINETASNKNVGLSKNQINLPAECSLNKILSHLNEKKNSFILVNEHSVNTKNSDHSLQNDNKPFLSIIMRTQGKRLHTLQEALTALVAQEDTDYELLILGHKLVNDDRNNIKEILSYYPTWFQDKCQLIEVNDGNRTRPLNIGFNLARGVYISVLDDDDIPFAHWVKTFKSLAADNLGQLLRATSVVQNIENVVIDNKLGVRATGGLEQRYANYYNFTNHFHHNETPPCSLSFPRFVFHDLNIHFDETLSTTEDWDFILSTAALCGVASTPEITSIYRWWTTDDSSRTAHSQQEWTTNYNTIINKHYSKEIILPAGEMRRIISRLFPDMSETLSVAGSTSNALNDDYVYAIEETNFPSLNRIFYRAIRHKINILKLKKIFLYFSTKHRRKIRKEIKKFKNIKARYKKLKNQIKL